MYPSGHSSSPYFSILPAKTNSKNEIRIPIISRKESTFPDIKGAIAAEENGTRAARAKKSLYIFAYGFLKRIFIIYSPLFPVKQFSCQGNQAWKSLNTVEKFNNVSKFSTPKGWALAFASVLALFLVIGLPIPSAHAELAEGGGYKLQYVISGGGAAGVASGDYRLLDVKFQSVVGVARATDAGGTLLASGELGWLYTFLPALYGPSGVGPRIALQILLDGLFDPNAAPPVMRSGTTVVLEARTGPSAADATTVVGAPLEISVGQTGSGTADWAGLPPGPGNYFIVLRHRADPSGAVGPNHLGIINASTTRIDPALSTNMINFSNPTAGGIQSAYTPSSAGPNNFAMRKRTITGIGDYFLLHPGDINGDGWIQPLDSSLWLGRFEQTPAGGGVGISAGDFTLANLNGDAQISGADASAWLATYEEFLDQPPTLGLRHSYIP